MEEVFLSVAAGSPDEVAGAGSRCGLLGGGSERAFVLFTERIDGRVIVGGGSATALGSGLSAGWLQAGTELTIKSRQKLGKIWLRQ